MRRTDLHVKSHDTMAKLIRDARAAGESAQTRPTGTLHLGDGDAVWDTPEGLRSVKDLPSAIDVEKLLQEGLTTESRRTTVSTSAPSVTEGFPAGAWWTQTTSAEDSTVTGVWRLVDGEWVAQDLPSDDLTAYPYADIGLLNVAVLSAQIITSGYFRTAATGKRIEIDSLGVRAYDENGNNTVNLNGFDNLVTGGFRTAVSGVRTEVLNSIWGGYWSGVRLWTSGLPNPAELKTNSGPYQAGWKTYGAGSLFLTSARGNADQSRSELALAPNMVDINMTDASGSTLKAGLNITPERLMMEHFGGTLQLRPNFVGFSSNSGKSGLQVGDGTLTMVTIGDAQIATPGVSLRLGPDGGGLTIYTDSGVIKHNAGTVVSATPVTSGSIDFLRAPNRYAVRTTTDTPSGTWGFLDVVSTGDGVIEHRFTTDTQGDWREWRRRSTSSTAWGAWVIYGPSTSVDISGAGMGSATGWNLGSPTIREKAGVIQLTFSVTPNGTASASAEHVVATTNAKLNSLATVRQQIIPWYAGGGGARQIGQSMWDKVDGKVYLKTHQDIPGNTTLFHSLTFL